MASQQTQLDNRLCFSTKFNRDIPTLGKVSPTKQRKHATPKENLKSIQIPVPLYNTCTSLSSTAPTPREVIVGQQSHFDVVVYFLAPGRPPSASHPPVALKLCALPGRKTQRRRTRGIAVPPRSLCIFGKDYFMSPLELPMTELYPVRSAPKHRGQGKGLRSRRGSGGDNLWWVGDPDA